MPLTRAKKTEKLKQLASELEHSTSAIVGTFKALTASKDMDLRKTVREAGGSYHVVKNKLAAKASEGTKIEGALQGLKGVSSVAYTSGDPVALAKALSAWVKDNSEFTFKLGIVDGKVISVEEVQALATMPGKEELFAKLLFLIQSPAQRLATVINATGRDLAVVINQGVEKEKFTGKSAAASAVELPPAEKPSAVASAPTPEVATVEASTVEAAVTEAPVVEAPVAEAPAVEPPAVEAPLSEPPAVEASVADSAVVESGKLVAEAHVEEAPTPEEQIAANPASEADPVAQPENGTASQAGEASTKEPAEG